MIQDPKINDGVNGIPTIHCFIQLQVVQSSCHFAGPGFLAVSPQVTLVINTVIGCRYFLPGLRLLSQLPAWPVPNFTAGDRGTQV